MALRREPTNTEIGTACNLSPDIVESLLGLSQPERSLDDPLDGSNGGDGRSRTLASVIRSDEGEADDRLPGTLEDDSRREAVRQALSDLAARDRKVLVLYYGLETGEPMTLDEIGRVLGVTRERVRQLRDRALTALRNGDAAEVLRDWAA
jgi:RNA polymerase primary sigma factor